MTRVEGKHRETGVSLKEKNQFLKEDYKNMEATLLEEMNENKSLTEKNQYLEQENKNLEETNLNSKLDAWNRNALRAEITSLKTEITSLKRQLAALHNPDAVVTPVVTPVVTLQSITLQSTTIFCTLTCMQIALSSVKNTSRIPVSTVLKELGRRSCSMLI